MIEDKATEKMKKRLKDMGLIVNMGAGKETAGTENEPQGKARKSWHFQEQER